MGEYLELSVDMKALQSSLSRVLKRKAKVLDDVRVRNVAAERYKNAIEKYVPMRTGNLRNSAHVSNGNIVYDARSKKGNHYAYASEQYHIPRSVNVRFTPNTYDHWDKHLTVAERVQFYEDLARDIAEAMNGR